VKFSPSPTPATVQRRGRNRGTGRSSRILARPILYLAGRLFEEPRAPSGAGICRSTMFVRARLAGGAQSPDDECRCRHRERQRLLQIHAVEASSEIRARGRVTGTSGVNDGIGR
jgi:hypothetical protein